MFDAPHRCRLAVRARSFLVPMLFPVIAACQAPPTPDPAVRYIAFGDSTTRGPAGQDYAWFLQERLGEPRESFTIEARGGETAGAGLERLQRILEEGLYPNARTLLYWQGGSALLGFATEVDPELALSPLDPDYPYGEELDLWLDWVEVEIQQVITLARSAGMIVYVATYYPPPEAVFYCRPLPGNLFRPEQAPAAAGYVALLNERIRLAAASQGAHLVDVALSGDELRSDPAYYFDCNHLSGRGNELVAELFLQVILDTQHASARGSP